MWQLYFWFLSHLHTVFHSCLYWFPFSSTVWEFCVLASTCNLFLPSEVIPPCIWSFFSHICRLFVCLFIFPASLFFNKAVAGSVHLKCLRHRGGDLHVRDITRKTLKNPSISVTLHWSSDTGLKSFSCLSARFNSLGFIKCGVNHTLFK